MTTHHKTQSCRAFALAASLDEIVWAINPANDTSQSLVDHFFPCAQKLPGHAGIRCRLEVIEPLPAGDLNAEERHEFFRAYKEALNNIIRHSGATQARVTISAAPEGLLVRVADNGGAWRMAPARARATGSPACANGCCAWAAVSRSPAAPAAARRSLSSYRSSQEYYETHQSCDC